MPSTLRIAVRNLGRNRRRTALALAAIALAQIAVLAMDGLMNGWVEASLEGMTGPMMGHAQIHAPGWREEQAPDLVIEDVDALLARVRAVPTVRDAYARIYSPALAARDVEGHAVVVAGVEMTAERADGGLLEGLDASAIPDAHGALIGATLAREAGIEVGDEIALLGQGADGSLANDLVTVTGILRTPLDLLNRRGVILHLETAQEIFAMEGRAHEINVRGTGGVDGADALVAALRRVDGADGLEILTWRELAPELSTMLEFSGVYGLVVLLIVFIAAAAGVANTMLMATFERRRELGMLLALGTTPGRLVRVVLSEAVVLGILGVAVGTICGVALVLYQGHAGIDPTTWGSHDESIDVAVNGLNWGGTIYPYLRAVDVLPGFLGVTLVSVVAALWPAVVTARLEPVEAMRS
ncbi:MAG: ABC transporter permease [Sandaracinaceae bacterium]|nr:ABC transporter permease [Sandaracinaceae bacterium]